MKEKKIYRCSDCGYENSVNYGKCPSCGSWGSMSEKENKNNFQKPVKKVFSFKQKTIMEEENSNDVENHSSENFSNKTGSSKAIVTSGKMKISVPERILSGFEEFDRVTGGGFVDGMVSLIAGEPGIGKSTLLMQICSSMSARGSRILYYSGEESPYQIFSRAERVAANDFNKNNFDVVSEASVESLCEYASDYDFLVVDSIQMAYSESCDGSPGSPSQIKNSAGVLVSFAKNNGIPTVIVGHITKDGDVAGPKVLEHMVDAVFVFSGDRDGQYRILKSFKNRFGAVDETGVFEMTEKGLKAVDDPSRTFWNDRNDMDSLPPGIAMSVSMEGNRPIAAEVQSLLIPTSFPYPKRTVSGVSPQRTQMIFAVLEKHASVVSSTSDSYVNIASGFKTSDTGIDLAIAASSVSSLGGFPSSASSCFFGEIGLAGEIRPVYGNKARLNEAVRLGFKKIFISCGLKKEYDICKIKEEAVLKKCEIIFVDTVASIVEMIATNSSNKRSSNK